MELQLLILSTFHTTNIVALYYGKYILLERGKDTFSPTSYSYLYFLHKLTHEGRTYKISLSK